MMRAMKRACLIAAAVTVAIVGATIVLISAKYLAQPKFGIGTYTMDGGTLSFMPPFYTRTPERKTIELTFTMSLPRWHSTVFSLTPDDCLQELVINGKHVQSDSLPYCNFRTGLIIDLREYLVAGENTVYAKIFNYGAIAKLLVEPSLSNGLYRGLFIGCISILLLSLLCTAIYAHKIALRSLVVIAMLYGTSMRLLYLACTSAHTRGHDVAGHIEYVEYLARHFRIPPLKGGWQFYHPPLYYVPGSVWYTVAHFLNFTEATQVRGLQWYAFLVSIGVLGLCVWIGIMLFQKQKRHLFLFLGICATLPSIVFFAARINNDVLVHAAVFGAFAVLLYWWQKQQKSYGYLWLLVITVTSVGMLSKTNAVIMLPVAYVCLIVHKKYRIHQKMLLGFLGVIIGMSITGWYYAYRFLIEKQVHVVENISHLNPALRLSNAPENFFEFNPVRMVFQPYNNPWSDEAGRQFFFEYLFRSAFVGEFNHGPILKPFAALLLGSALVLCIPAFMGFWHLIKKKTYASLPLWLAFLVSVITHIVFLISSPFASAQDFRYSPLLLIPGAYFVLHGIDTCSTCVQRLLRSVVFVFISLCMLFLLVLFWQ